MVVGSDVGMIHDGTVMVVSIKSGRETVQLAAARIDNKAVRLQSRGSHETIRLQGCSSHMSMRFSYTLNSGTWCCGCGAVWWKGAHNHGAVR
ncbi:unnamed protein product [Prunus armeniaca]|uniref:Uncharacterized protein n=1 Tax=Prunus armeniaca TaxID=36596 RepID=A0A6J5WH08_PRUAR|nr:unnamed protein product [Prunus armeniaca]CAB4299365.1 unnamed protein product [Prunus armeniaca]